MPRPPHQSASCHNDFQMAALCLQTLSTGTFGPNGSLSVVQCVSDLIPCPSAGRVAVLATQTDPDGTRRRWPERSPVCLPD